MELKGRLGAIAAKIPVCDTLADVGTDHAYIPVYGVLKGICRKALATDIRTGPVKIAEQNIRRYGLYDKIEARLGPGLGPVAPREADIAVIAGMGGLLICEILQDSLEKARRMKLFILQPMNSVEVLRKWLNEEGFKIYEEALAAEGNKIYNIICTGWTGSSSPRDEYDYYTGRELMLSGDPLLEALLAKKLKQLDVVIEGRKKSDAGRDELESIIRIRERLLIDLQRVGTAGGSI